MTRAESTHRCPECNRNLHDEAGTTRKVCVNCKRSYETAALIAPMNLDDVRESGTPADDLAERVLQNHCESHLTLKGYARMTPELHARCANDPLTVGWFSHIPAKRARGISQFSDLLILNRQCTRVLCVELKRRGKGIKWEPGQREMVEAGNWKHADVYDDFVRIVREWESVS